VTQEVTILGVSLFFSVHQYMMCWSAQSQMRPKENGIAVATFFFCFFFRWGGVLVRDGLTGAESELSNRANKAN